MKLETLLPLGTVDPGLRAPEVALNLATVFDDARLVEELGYDGMVVEETKDDPYVIMALAAQATTRLQLGTSVAMAFPRSPTITAMSAWTLQKLSKGRFSLGLGTQVKGHIERRFGLTWSPPGPWIREYVQAVRAVWACWQNGAPLNFEGDHYRLSLMVPLFNPGPIDHPGIPIHLAAVNPYMGQVAGEVADGVRPHPVCTPGYIENVMLPAVRKGAERAGRIGGAGRHGMGGFTVRMKPLIATAATEAELQDKIRDVRARIAFYASTPTYFAAFAFHGLQDLATRLKTLSREQRWEEMPQHISDEVLHTYAVVGTYDEIADKLQQRYGDLVTHVEFSIPAASPSNRDRLRAMVKQLQGKPPPAKLAATVA
jgi:probable F420-dependent oxidoreductase